MISRGWPSVVTSLTGVIAMPIPCVKLMRSLTQPPPRALGSSSRAESMTWRWTSAIV